MTDSPLAQGRPIVVGANHRSSTMAMRDRIFVEDERVPAVLDALLGRGLDQVILLSTCDRVEVIGVCDDADGFARAVLDTLADEGECAPGELDEQAYTLTDAAAVEHVFRVTASLDSLMVGEPQVLGQVKHAHRQARETDHLRAELETLMQAAYAAAKRVRTETKIGEGPVSMAASAVQIARDLFGDLNRCKALLVGSGEMGEMIATDLMASGVSSLTVTHPRAGRADGVARRLNAHMADFDQFETVLAHSDIVLSAVGTRHFSLRQGVVKSALKARRHRPMFIVDAGVPGDVEPEVEVLDDAFVYGLGDLEQVALKGRAGREQESARAEEIIKHEVEHYQRTRAERAAVPALAKLRTKFEAARSHALNDAGGDAEKATRLLLGRLLHDPSQAMRRIAADDEVAWARLEFALERLFDLDDQY